MYIYLYQSTERLLENIKERGRSYEQEIPAEYLEKINKIRNTKEVNAFAQKLAEVALDNYSFIEDPETGIIYPTVEHFIAGMRMKIATNKPEHLNPRAIAVKKLIAGDCEKIVDPIFSWDGPWQSEWLKGTAETQSLFYAIFISPDSVI